MMSKEEALKEMEATYDRIHTYSQSNHFEQEEWEARQKIIALQAYVRQIK